MEKNTIESLFGGGALTWAELAKAAGENGIEIGDVLGVKREYSARLSRERAERAVERCLDRAHAKNPELVGKMLDRGSDDDCADMPQLEGRINVQIEELKKSAPYLFEDGGETARILSTGAEHGGARRSADELDDYEYYKTVKKI